MLAHIQFRLAEVKKALKEAEEQVTLLTTIQSKLEAINLIYIHLESDLRASKLSQVAFDEIQSAIKNTLSELWHLNSQELKKINNKL